MKNLWLRIGLGAAGIFAVGMLVVTGIRAGKSKLDEILHSDAPIAIPLMGTVPFQLSDARLGNLRRLTLLRDAPQHLTGVQVEAALADSASLEPLKECAFLTVNSATQLNSQTRFLCVTDTAGLRPFGTVEVTHVQGGEPTVLVRTLLLPQAVVTDLQESMGPRVNVQFDSAQMARLNALGDSMGALGDASDPAQAERLRALGDTMRMLGDSIRAATRIQVELARAQARAYRDKTRGPRGAGTRVRVQDSAAAVPTPPAPAPAPVTP